MINQTNRDVAEWVALDPMAAEPGAYPRLLYNVNLPPVLVHNEEQEASKGAAWRPVDLLDLPDVPPVTLSASSASLDELGGPVEFTVTVTGPGVSGTWTVDKDSSADWLTVMSPTEPQTESGDVLADVASNIGGTSRTANMYVNGQTFAVTQAGV